MFIKKVKDKINEIITNPDFEKQLEKYFSSLSKEEKLGGILSDFGSNADILNELGYTPFVLVKEFGFGEKGLRNIGYTPGKLKGLGYNIKDFYKSLK